MRHQRIVAALVLAGPQGLSVDSLADRVWDPDETPTSPIPTLRTYVKRLRSTASDEDGTGASVGEECAGDLPTVKVRSRAKGEEGAAGATLVERFVTRATFYVYEGNGLDAVEFFGQVCASLSTGGEAPTLIATGRGLVKRRVDVAYNGAAGAQRAQPRQQHVAALSRDHARRSRYVRRGASARILACYVPAMSSS